MTPSRSISSGNSPHRHPTSRCTVIRRWFCANRIWRGTHGRDLRLSRYVEISVWPIEPSAHDTAAWKRTGSWRNSL